MTVKAENIVAEALTLPVTVRAYVAEKIIESLDADAPAALSPTWQDEIRRRCDELDRGTAQLCDADAVFAKAFTALG